MSVQYYPNGIGGDPPGDFLDTCRPLQTSGNIWYVSSLIGVDAAGAGWNREKPLATLAQAHTNAANEDIIVFLPGHTQTLGVTQTISKSVTLIGEGVTNGKPSVSFSSSMPAQSMFAVTAQFVELRNLYFPASTVANTAARINVTSNDFLVRGCYLECGGNDGGAAFILDAFRPRFESSTFISTAVNRTARPSTVMACDVATPVGIVMRDVVVSAGEFGFVREAIDFTTGVGILSQIKIEGLSLLLGADMALPTTATGRVNIQLSTGGSRVRWC